jgi:hypothetical protein
VDTKNSRPLLLHLRLSVGELPRPNKMTKQSRQDTSQSHRDNLEDLPKNSHVAARSTGSTGTTLGYFSMGMSRDQVVGSVSRVCIHAQMRAESVIRHGARGLDGNLLLDSLRLAR